MAASGRTLPHEAALLKVFINACAEELHTCKQIGKANSKWLLFAFVGLLCDRLGLLSLIYYIGETTLDECYGQEVTWYDLQKRRLLLLFNYIGDQSQPKTCLMNNSS